MSDNQVSFYRQQLSRYIYKRSFQTLDFEPSEVLEKLLALPQWPATAVSATPLSSSHEAAAALAAAGEATVRSGTAKAISPKKRHQHRRTGGSSKKQRVDAGKIGRKSRIAQGRKTARSTTKKDSTTNGAGEAIGRWNEFLGWPSADGTNSSAGLSM